MASNFSAQDAYTGLTVQLEPEDGMVGTIGEIQPRDGSVWGPLFRVDFPDGTYTWAYAAEIRRAFYPSTASSLSRFSGR